MVACFVRLGNEPNGTTPEQTTPQIGGEKIQFHTAMEAAVLKPKPWTAAWSSEMYSYPLIGAMTNGRT